MHTVFREKIGSHLSYPVKVAELQELLSPTDELLGIGVRFFAYKAPRQNETRPSYPIIEASYDPSGEENWSLTVSPIPRSTRKAVRLLLLPALADRIRPWLIAKRKPGWYLTYHSLRCRFDTSNETLTFQEHNSV
jgi:hypothetical protein